MIVEVLVFATPPYRSPYPFSMRLQISSFFCRASASLCLVCIGVAALAQGADNAAPGYRVSRGDELNFRFLYAAELNTVATVRSDGRVALPYAGEFVAEGLSMDELKTLVEQRISSQVRRPQVVVNVAGGASQRVFVGGEVGRPGMQPLIGPLTALQAVMVAEGLKDGAQPRDVLVLRRGPQGERQVLPVDLAAAMAGAEGARDITLQPYDVVIVPRSGIASVNLWIDQYIRRVLPFSTGFSYTINRDGVVR